MPRHDVDWLARVHGQSLVRLAYVLVGDSDEAQDVVQSVLVRLVDADLTRVEDLASYARGAVANEVVSRGRRNSRLTRLWPKLLAPASVDSAETTVVDRRALLESLSRLSARQRTVLVLRYFEDLDDSAIAVILGCSRATVRSIAARALSGLRSAAERGEH